MPLLFLHLLSFTVILTTTIVTAGITNTKEEETLRYTLQEFKDHRGRVQVTLTSGGEGIFSGPLISRSGTCDLQQVKVTGNATFFKDLHVPSGEAHVRNVVVYHHLVTQEKSNVDFYGQVTFREPPAKLSPPQQQRRQLQHNHIHRHPQQNQPPPPQQQVHFLNGWKSSGNVQVDGAVDATSVTVKDHLLVNSFQSHGNGIVDGTLHVGKEAKFAAALMVSELQASANVVVGQILSVKGSTMIEGDTKIRGNVDVGTSIQAPVISASLLNASSRIDANLVQTSGLQVFYDAQIGGHLFVSKNASIAGRLLVEKLMTNSIDANTSVCASSASISGNLNASSINASSISVASQIELSGAEAKPLKSINGYESSDGGIEVAKNIISHGHLAAKLGVSTSNLTAYGKVLFEGDDTFIHKLQARDIVVSSGMKLYGGANLTIDAPGILHSKGGILIENGTLSEIRGDALVSGKFHFTETLKVTGTVESESIFTSRIYTEDVSARGFVSATTFVSTGDVDVSKNVTVGASVLAKERVEANHLVSRSSLSAPMATLDRISTAAITVQKVFISSELIVQDVNVMQLIAKEIKLLNDRIDALERKLST